MKIHSALRELTVARIKEMLRTPEALFWVFVFPVILALALGLAFREKAPEKIPIGLIEEEGSAETLRALEQSPVLLPRHYSAEGGRQALTTGRISLLVKRGLKVSFIFDPTRPDSRIARLEADKALQEAAQRKDPVTVELTEVREPGARYIDFLIPGLVGLNLMGTGMWGVGFSIVIARSQKLLKRLVATPMRKSDYLLSQILARLIFLAPEVIILVGFGALMFGVTVRGSLLTLALICVLGAMTFAGLGVLVAARVETVEGVSGLMNFVMLPMWLLSGTFFSANRFPDAVQPLIRALPLTALNDALRAVMTQGKGITEIGTELAIVAAWGLVSFAISLRIFRWQ